MLALALLFRHGGLLLHDLEETHGRRTRSGHPARALRAAPPPARGDVPGLGLGAVLWMLALLFIYLDTEEKIVVGVLLVCGLAVGPLVKLLEARNLAQRNPLFQAGVESLEGGPDTRATAAARGRGAAERRRPRPRLPAGRSVPQGGPLRRRGRALPRRPAPGSRRQLRPEQPRATWSSRAASSRPPSRATSRASRPRRRPPVGATFYYNLSLAHLQRFEYQPAQEARSQADRLASGLVRSYDSTWKYDKGDYAVVDLAPTDDELWAKFLGTRARRAR